MKEERYISLQNRQPGIMGEKEAHHSAVAITLLETTEGEMVLFEIRSEKLAHQPGDICCPGGMVDEGETPEQAVIREMTEELLVTRDQIRILGPMDMVYGANMMIHPYVCQLKDYEGAFNKDEVSEVFCVPISFFRETTPEIHEVKWRVELGEDFPFEKIHGGRDYSWRERKDRILFYEYEGHVIWGMTAKLIKAFVDLTR